MERKGAGGRSCRGGVKLCDILPSGGRRVLRGGRGAGLLLRVRSTLTTGPVLLFLLFFFFSFFQMICIGLTNKDGHPPSPRHTWRLKYQHHEIITPFANSSPRNGFALRGGVHLPSSSPTLRFIPLGFLDLWLMDFVFF